MARSESPVIVPQQTKLPLIKAEIAVLKTHLEDWRTVKGKQRQNVLNAIHREACLQAPTRDKAMLKSRKKTYKEWLYNQCRWKAPKPLIKYGKKWTAHRVLIEQNKAQIQEETGDTPGSEGMITKWPEATKTVLASLSAEEKEEARVTAEKWNNEAALPDIQANVAEIKGADMIEHFATEMFKQAGMRIFVMSAWQNREGKLMLGVHDFNEQCGGGESFLKTRDWEGNFMPDWRQYAGEQFDVQDQDVPQIVTAKKRVPRKLLELEEDDDGWPMLPDTTGWKRSEQQHIIQSFLTRHYRMCMGKEKAAAAVPWGDLVKSQSDFFDDAYWPADVQLVEPSKMDKADTTALLYFWHRRQQRKLRPTFCFKAWKDTDGDMEKLAKSFCGAMRRATQHGQSTSKQKHASRQDEQSGDEEEEEEERQSSADEDQEVSMSANDRNESFPIKVVQRGLLPVSIDGPGDELASDNLAPHINDSTGRYTKATPPVRSKTTSNITVALNTADEPAKSGPRTARQGLRSNVENEPPAKASKRRAAAENEPQAKASKRRAAAENEPQAKASKRRAPVENEPPTKASKRLATAPISDTPARRTRSKAAVADAPKAKQSRK
ncbi:hypothetical protein DEU56DRAFT_762207 [Suillus clintonianus]|uniref:uncharacterized protein n=1 Tax=Suillus clintonianus TaxID=1904413 RepID=UPI001B85F98E|nr:uncharacterized protein DEU56DRAFT_762207 [Suillus clintonianus]KAG2111436.1 hypothetical protein DEU56DRAFT_762207 [Suillus clintonianus]